TPEAVTEAAKQFGRSVGPQASIDALLRDSTETIGELNRNYSEVVTKLEALVVERDQLQQELRRADEKLATMALTDSVSGLPNHRAFREALTRDLARADRANTHVALIVVDLDQFQQVNAEYGPSAADLVLAGVSEELLGCVRVSDVLARIAGETFALLLPNTNLPGAMVVAERARARISERNFVGPRGAFQVTASLGVAVTLGPEIRGRPGALLTAAERGVEQARKTGDRVVLGVI
ncbi:MAG: hypothetical protein RL701_2256, partial [Pseudomonadota bacterium]